jgi:hypothetical protein
MGTYSRRERRLDIRLESWELRKCAWGVQAEVRLLLNNKIITIFGLKSAISPSSASSRPFASPFPFPPPLDSLHHMDDPSLNPANPISPISQLLKNLGMTRDDLTRHSDQMRQFLTAENANSLRAFSNAESDAESAKSPTILPQVLRAKSRSISAADAPPPSFPPATPIKTEPVEPAASSSLRRFESMDEIIERQNRRSKRERRSRRERDASPGALPHSPTRSSLRASGHPRSAATRDACDPGRAKAVDESLPANIGLSRVRCAVIVADYPYATSLLTFPAILYRIYCHILPRPAEPAAIIGILSSIRPSHLSTVALLVIMVSQQ